MLCVPQAIPDYGSREVVLLCGSLTTCDPGDIFDTVKKLLRHKVRVRSPTLITSKAKEGPRHLGSC